MKIDIVVCSDTRPTDEKLRPFFWALRNSNPKNELVIHYVTVGGTPEFNKTVSLCCSSFNLPCLFYEVGEMVEEMFSDGLCRTSYGHLTLAAYARLCVAEVLPDTVSKVVYMDYDTICTGDLKYLIEETDGCQTICATSDMILYWLEKKEWYFNSGILVIPIEAWRSENVLKGFSSTLVKMIESGDYLENCDQDVLNRFFAKKWMKFPWAWNAQAYASKSIVDFWKSSEAKNPKIFHYVGIHKPWKTKSGWSSFPRPAAIAYARALVFSSSKLLDRARHTILLSVYYVIGMGEVQLAYDSFKARLIFRLSEVLFGKESPLCVFRWLKRNFVK